MAILNMFAGSGGGGVRIPLESPTALTAVPAASAVQLKWTDPVDKVANPGGEAVATWNYTIVVRKVGSYPQTPGDGVEIVREKTRNQYQSTPYTDTSYLENGITYYYSVFAVSTIGVWSEPAQITAQPRDSEFVYGTSLSATYPLSGYDYDFDASASAGSYAVFIGLATEGNDYGRWTMYSNAVAFNKEGTMSQVGGNPARLSASGSMNGCAFFGGGCSEGDNRYGDEESTVIMFNSSLTRSQNSAINSFSEGAAASVGDHMLFAGGQYSTSWPQYSGIVNTAVSAFNISLTRVTAGKMPDSMRVQLGGASTSSYAIFAGGSADYSNLNGALGQAYAYDSSLTRLSAGNMSARHQIGCATNSGRAIFAGGGTSSRWQPTNAVDAFDDSLTRQALTGLFSNGIKPGAVGYENNALFVGGTTSINGNPIYGNRATLYDSSLTRKDLPNLSTARFIIGAMAENVGIFVGKEKIDTYVYQ